MKLTNGLKEKINNIQDTLQDLKEVVSFLLEKKSLAKDSTIASELQKMVDDIQNKGY